MKKLTAGIFATILGLTAVDAFAAPVASTQYVQGAIESLDSSATAQTGKYISGVTMTDGKITNIVETDLPTFTDTNTEYTAGNFVNIDENNVITTTYKPGTNVEITADGTINATDTNTEYTEGNGITISEDNVISSDIVFSTGLNATTDVNGKVTVTANTSSLQGAINMEQKSATDGYAIKSVKVENGQLAITETAKLFTNGDVNGGEADAGANKLLQSVKLENGVLSAVTTVDIVDVYPYQPAAQ